MNKKSASTTLYIIFFLVIFLAFAAFAVDGAIILTQRAKLQNITEMTALVAASEFNFKLNPDNDVNINNQIITQVTDTANNTFNLLKNDSLQTANININADADANEVKITTNIIALPLFLRFLGVSGINLEAKACAQSEPLDIKPNYTGINWLSAKAAYLSDILSKSPNMNNTAILLPLGNFPSASYDLATSFVNFSLIIAEDHQPLSLGPGGFITIKLPAPIVDKPGQDLFIKEADSAKCQNDPKCTNALEGYMVFAGLDKDPNNPYVDPDNVNGDILWVNISCSGTPEKPDANGLLKTYNAPTYNLGNQDKFYGSGYFDIGASCIGPGGISMAKYIRIVDDNSESALVTTDQNNYYKAMLYGEASTATAGVDIDAVRILNHVKLIK